LIAEATILGVALALLAYERTGLTPGGLIVPAYLALFVDQPERIAGTLAVSLFSLLLYRLLAKVFLLYGRRRFATLILLGVVLKALSDVLLVSGMGASLELRSVGFIVAGLIANDFERQGVPATLAMLSVVTAATYLGLLLIQAWQVAG
jgi:gamma-polyglutamate biosynthesis protein CapC